MFAALFGALMNALENILDKVILKEKGMSHRHYLSISMTTLFVFSVIAYVFFGQTSAEFFTPKYLLFFSALIFVAFFYNIIFFWAMSVENLCDVEPFVLIDRPAAVILAAAFFPSERSLIPLVFTLVAAAALVLSRLERHHLKIKKTTLGLSVFVVLIAFEAVFVKILLDVFNPVALYTFRTGFLAALFWIFLRPDLKKINFRETMHIVGNGVVTYAQYIARFYAILYIGVVQTSLFLLLGPVLALVFSKFFMKENLPLKKAIADGVIVACVIVVLLTN